MKNNRRASLRKIIETLDVQEAETTLKEPMFSILHARKHKSFHRFMRLYVIEKSHLCLFFQQPKLSGNFSKLLK